jgi:hypothetical protein
VGTKRRQWARGFATTERMAKEVNEKLPLAGIRVLDMTRVLAGVGVYYIGSFGSLLELTANSQHAHKYLEILGMSFLDVHTMQRLMEVTVQR